MISGCWNILYINGSIETLLSADLAGIASQFVDQTKRHIFLTGRAGTGKTTFLRNLAKTTYKRLAIVAPTGIAALNAGGVTIHSQFLFPFGAFAPTHQAAGSISEDVKLFTQKTLATRHPLNKPRKEILRNIELLVIDEVSMLRADMLDAIDYRLKSARQNFKESFGGVQLLLIGDMHQLPPIVNDQEWAVMRQFYPSMFFFDSLALKQAGFAHIELDKIYRQSDPTFIELLNHVRDNQLTQDEFDQLNTHYNPTLKDTDTAGVITLTTHNYQAQQINEGGLKALDSKEFSYKATIEGDFPDSMFPIPEEMTLKVGAQVMFVKNDTVEGRYFNGKLAEVRKLTADSVTVRLEGEKTDFAVPLEEWVNKRYTIDPKSKEMNEVEIGTFRHFPLKLAWAITIHKSQGLTFDRAIIEAGRAFAPGQVYVALSRLTSLKGLVLKTPITQSAISTSSQVASFARNKLAADELTNRLEKHRLYYLQAMFSEAFDFQAILTIIEKRPFVKVKAAELQIDSMKNAMVQLEDRFRAQLNHTGVFRQQLTRLLMANELDELYTRLTKGSAYYASFFKENVEILLNHLAEMATAKKVKTYTSFLEELDQLFLLKWENIERVQHVTQCVIEGKEVDRNAITGRARSTREAIIEKIKSGGAKADFVGTKPTVKKKRSGEKKPKVKTVVVTKELLDEGLTIDEVAERRGLNNGTIEGHVAQLIEEGEIELESFIDTESRKTIAKELAKSESVTEVVNALNKKFTYGQVRMVRAFLKRKSF